MFGYLQVYKAELLIKDFESYKSVYCGLCKQLGKDYGILSRMTLSYDCTLLALVYMAINDSDVCFERGRCVVNPLKKCSFCVENEGLKFASAVSAILSYYKMKDDIEDSGFFKSIIIKFISLFFKRGYKKAKKNYPNIENITSEFMRKQFDIERSENPTIDLSANPTAEFISNLIMTIPNPHNISNVILEKFGYFLGRWIYLIDASDDYEKDKKNNNFNPFVNYFKNKENVTNEEVADYCNNVLNFTVYQITLAYNLIEFNHFKRVLDNIINYGLPNMQKKCLFDKCKKDNYSKG